ncbi:hypothetical protein chiPu_0026342, partial [Chiloscyllium punctatum]|nr:hypothetical protein [Chiloscyllium punctatum]
TVQPPKRLLHQNQDSQEEGDGSQGKKNTRSRVGRTDSEGCRRYQGSQRDVSVRYKEGAGEKRDRCGKA